MNRRRLNLIFLWALGFIVAVDLVHGILNRIYRPFTGPADTAMHFVLAAALIFYPLACLWGCFRIAKWFSSTNFLSKNHYAALVLFAVLACEIGFTLLMPARSGSSRYHPLFPDYVGGMILAMATMIAGREQVQSRIGSVFLALVTFFWATGALTVDLLWYTERTERGVGPVWHTPVIGTFLTSVSYIFIFGGQWLERCLNFPDSILKGGPIIEIVWYGVLTVVLACCLRWAARRGFLVSIALAASAIFLCCKAVEWSSYIAD